MLESLKFLGRVFVPAKPCKRGHRVRFRHNGACAECYRLWTSTEGVEWNKAYQKENREKITATAVAWQRRNPDKVKAAREKYNAPRRKGRIQKAPPEVLSAKNVANVKRWREENPGKLQAQRAKDNFVRRSAVRGRIIEKIAVAFLIEQRKRQNDLCAYCGTPLFEAGHQDHIIPIARGGAHVPKNIVWACEPCNLRKGAKLGWIPFWGMRK